MGNKFDIRFYNEDEPVKETRKDQKIKHQLYERRTGRIPRPSKAKHRVARQEWNEDAES